MNLTAAGASDIFVVKYNSNGTVAWASRAGGPQVSGFGNDGFDEGHGIALDGSGNSYVTGWFASTATFGPGEPNQTQLTTSGTDDIFVAKYNSNGTLAWVRGVGSTASDKGSAISVDGSGNAYVTGRFTGTVTFGSGEPNQTQLTSASASFYDIFVAKYNGNGTLAWAKQAGSTSTDQGFGIAVDVLGNSYVTGSFSGTATFGLGDPNETQLTSAGSHDIFVGKFAAVMNTDTTPPDTSITSSPAAVTNSTSAIFSFTSTEAGSTFGCSLDGSAFTACTSPQSYSSLTSGSHTFQVRATDAANNTDQTPASFTWTIDITPPDTTITSAPPATTNSTSASFSFTSTEAGSTFACSLDGAGFTACASPQNYTGLAVTSHNFQVTAVDAAGNFDTTPASHIWTINAADTTPPETTITSGPPATTNSTSASFSFTSTEAGSTFECSLDGAAFTACASPQNYTSLAVGNHNFQVRAIDAAGNVDTTPASYTWTINALDTTPPVLTNFVVNTPIVATGTGPATFRATLTAQDDQSGVERAGLSIQSSNGSRHISNCARVGGTPPSATFECTLNLPQFSAAGAWIIDLSVTDAAGNGPHVYTSTELASLGFDSTFIVSAQPPNTIPAQLPAGLVSWWDGDFVSGATVLDLGSGINGALVNGATAVAGKGWQCV